MLENFRTYQMAVALYKECNGIKLNGGLKDQLERASSSVVLNLAEGSAKKSAKDRARFYQIALGSLRETQAILELKGMRSELTNKLGGSLYCLIRNPGPDL